MGLWMVGVLKVGFLYKEARFHYQKKPAGFLGSVLVGSAFAAGWTPCVGPVLAGILGAGILAAIMSSLDSQFFCIGTIFTSELNHYFGQNRFTDKQQVAFARGFIVLVVVITYLLSLQGLRQVFQLGIWCFSGFSALFPIVFASLYWKRVNKHGAIASVIVTTVVWFILFRNSGYGADREYLVLGMMPVVIIFFASTAALIVASLATQPMPKETIDKYFF